MRFIADRMIVVLYVQDSSFLSLVVEDFKEGSNPAHRRQVSNLNTDEILPLSLYSIHWKGADCWLNNRRVDIFRA